MTLRERLRASILNFTEGQIDDVKYSVNDVSNLLDMLDAAEKALLHNNEHCENYVCNSCDALVLLRKED